jgi:hypothetical protein
MLAEPAMRSAWRTEDRQRGETEMFTSPRTLRLVGAIGLGMALTLPAASAMAAPPDKFADRAVFINCFELTGPGGEAFFSVNSSETSGASASLQLWLDPDDPQTGPPTLVNGDTSIQLAPDGASLSGTMELLPGELGLQAAGSATFVAMFEPNGQTEVIENRFGDSNVKHRSTDVITPLAVSGTLTVSVPGQEDLVFSLDGCDGLSSDAESFTNQPNSLITWRSDQFLLCTYVTDELYVGLHAEAAAGIVGADMILLTPTDAFGSSGDNVVTLDRNGFATTFELASGGVGLQPLTGTAVASATFSVVDTIEFQLRREDGRRRVEIQVFSASGSIEISLSDGTQISVPLNDETCHTNYVRAEREMESSPNGGNTRPLTNDTPATAESIQRGDVVSAHTGGAAFDGEAFASCAFDGPFLLNVAHSAWYEVTGTGEPITLDTAGSSFDTVIGVYVGEELTEVACNDEAETATPHQARLTFDTEPGVTYLVQVGGYVDQSGHLILRVD